jgi:hypothetical protein
MKKVIFIIQMFVLCVYAKNISIQDYINESQYVLSEKNIDINNDNKMDTIYLCLSENRNLPNLLFVFIQERKDEYKLFLKKELENFKDRPYNGYSLDSNRNNLLLNLSYPQDRGGDLEKYSFEISYSNGHLFLKNIYYKNSNLCNFSLMETYLIDLNLLENKNLEIFNPLNAFKKFEEKKFDDKYFHKILTDEMKDEYKILLNLFKSQNIRESKIYIEDKIIINNHDLDDSKCYPDNYMNRYFFIDNISYTNDIAFFLEQSSHNDEAIFLLEKIIEKFPNRTVAYLNLADAYNGINDKEKAKENYKKYINLMKQDKKENKIPQRVLEYK